MDVVYPHVTVKLTGEDSNAFMMVGRTGREMRRAGVPDAEIVAFREEATSGDYDHVIQTIMKYVNVI